MLLLQNNFYKKIENWKKKMSENVPVYSISYFLDTMYPAAPSTMGNVPALTSGEQEIVSFIQKIFLFLFFIYFFNIL